MDQPYRSPLLDRPGAVEGSAPDAGVAAHYGDPFREQRALAEGRGLVDLSHRDVLRVSGPDRLTWLHQLTTQYFEALAAHTPVDALVLDANGRVEHALYGVDDGSATWFHLEPGTSAPLVDYLVKMRFWSQVEIDDVTASYAVMWAPPRTSSSQFLTRTTKHGSEIFVPRADLVTFADAAGPLAGTLAHEALRIAAHEPRLHLDTDDRTIPHEVGWIGTAVHLDKGCYRGQETVARVHTMGRPPRRLVMLHLDGSADELPEHGATVEHDGRAVGFVGSAARHYELGPIALAVVKRNTPAEANMTAGGVDAAQEVVVDPDVGLHVRPSMRG